MTINSRQVSRLARIASRLARDYRRFYNSTLAGPGGDQWFHGLVPRAYGSQIAIGGGSVRTFAGFVGRRLVALNPAARPGGPYDIIFERYVPSPNGIQLGEFVAWLQLCRRPSATRPGLFKVFYNDQKILDLCSKGHCQERVIRKVFIHELGHAVLHCDQYFASPPGATVRMDETRECEANVLSLFFWGLVLGEFSVWTRVKQDCDLSWKSN